MIHIKSQLMAICIVFALSGCGGKGSPAEAIPDIPDTKSDITAMMEKAKVPGVSIAVINNFEIVEDLALGVIDQNSQQATTENTLFQAASISKAVTAVATMKWATDTQTPIDTPLKDMLTIWQLPENGLTTENEVTIEGILRHTSGINVHGFLGYDRSAPLPTLIQVLDGSNITNSDPIEVTSSPDGEWRYSGGGYTVLQQAIEDQTDMSFEDFMNWQIIDFLGLSNSTFDLEDNIEGATISSGHRQNGSPLSNQFHVYPEKAAAGFWTNARDLAKFGIEFQLALRGDSQLFSAEIAQKMLESTLSPDYALGLELYGEGRFGHAGVNEGFVSIMALDPNGFGVAILTNSDNGSLLLEPIVEYFEKKYK